MRDAIATQHLPPFFAYAWTLVSDYRVVGKSRVQNTVVRRVDLRAYDGIRCIVFGANPAVYVDAPTMTPLTYARVVSAELPLIRDSALAAEPDDALPTIGRANAARTSRYYRITRVGRETIDGIAVERLKLVPRFDVDRHPWREAWIDTATDRLVRARVVGRVRVEDTSGRIEMVLDFAQVADVTTITRVFAEDVIHMGPNNQYVDVRLDEKFSDFVNSDTATPECGAFPPQKSGTIER